LLIQDQMAQEDFNKKQQVLSVFSVALVSEANVW
jgi:hypothetical protein